MESGDEDEMQMAQRDWERMKGSLEKSGFRAGIDKGETDNLQKYAESCLALCKKHYRSIGNLQGFILSRLCKCPETGSDPNRAGLEAILCDLKVYLDTLHTSGILEPGSGEAEDTFQEFLDNKAKVLNASFLSFKTRLLTLLELTEEDYEGFFRALNMTVDDAKEMPEKE